MKKLIIIAALTALGGCAQVVSANPKQVTVNAPPVAYGEAQALADQHCLRYEKSAVPAGVMYGNNIVYRCE